MIKYSIKNSILSREIIKDFEIFVNFVEKVPFPSYNPYILREQIADSKCDILKQLLDISKSNLKDKSLLYRIYYHSVKSSYFRLILINYLIDTDSLENVNYLRCVEENKKDKIINRLNNTDIPFFHLVNLNRLWYYTLLSWFDPRKNQDLLYYYNNI